MSKSKSLSLGVSALYVIAFVYLASRNQGLGDVMAGVGVLLIWIFLSLACIWFSDGIEGIDLYSA